MTRTLLALIVLTLGLSACEPSSNENSSNANAARPNATSQTTPVASPSVETSSPARSELKTGDKVKVTIKGAAADATIVSVDEKAGKAVVRVQGEKEDKTVAIADIVKQ